VEGWRTEGGSAFRSDPNHLAGDKKVKSESRVREIQTKKWGPFQQWGEPGRRTDGEEEENTEPSRNRKRKDRWGRSARRLILTTKSMLGPASLFRSVLSRVKACKDWTERQVKGVPGSGLSEKSYPTSSLFRIETRGLPMGPRTKNQFLYNEHLRGDVTET